VDSRRTEQRLRAAIAAHGQHIEATGLRHADISSPRTRQRRLGLAVPSAVVAAFAIAVGVWAYADPSAHRVPDIEAAPPLTVTVTTRTSMAHEVSPALARPTPTNTHTSTTIGTRPEITYQVPAVSGGRPHVASRIEAMLTSRISRQIEAYRERLAGSDPPGSPPTLQITIGSVERWGRYLSVRVDQVASCCGPQTHNTSFALVLDTENGSAVNANQLLTDTSVVDLLMREAIIRKAGTTVDSSAAAKLSMIPDTTGGTRPLAWYPAADGLHWVIDQCAIAACRIGQLQTTLPWTQLTGLTTTTTGR
jgi:hypothetical protein